MTSLCQVGDLGDSRYLACTQHRGDLQDQEEEEQPGLGLHHLSPRLCGEHDGSWVKVLHNVRSSLERGPLGSVSDPVTCKETKLARFHVSESPLMASAELLLDLSRVEECTE